ncbi:MAG: heparinase II/III family protein [Victivallaceae bacterium]|nr:heparinase II/III family protein [Victivallaceae bacterium]
MNTTIKIDKHRKLGFFFFGICMILNFQLEAYTISSSHPRLLITSEDVSRIRNEHAVDGDMEDVDCTLWPNEQTPYIKEKIDFDGSRRLHISTTTTGGGARQSLPFKEGVEYEYSVDVYVVNGTCAGQLYQYNNYKSVVYYNTVGQWQTFTGTFVTNANPLIIRFYATGGSAEFYIDNFSFRPTYQKIADKDMESVDCSDWPDERTPITKEKIDFEGSKRLHIVGDSGGARQSLQLKSGVEYEYSVDIYVVSGSCLGQLYQYNNYKLIAYANTPGQWQTFTGTFVASKNPPIIRFYCGASNSEFYIDNVSLKPSRERINDSNMMVPDCYSWRDEQSPTLKEKVVFDGKQRLHLTGPSGSGVRQSINFKTGVEYEYSVDIYVVSGGCAGQLYQYGNAQTLFYLSSGNGQWQTFTGTFTPGENPLIIRFYGLGTAPEFYIDNVSFVAKNSVDDNCPKIGLGALYDYALQLENSGAPNPSPAALANLNTMVGETRSIAFVAMISEEDRFIDLAIDYALAIAAKNASDGDDGPQRERLLSMAFVYDWLNDKLSTSEKDILRDSMVAHIQQLERYITSPLFSGGHSRYGNTTILGALLAMHGEYGTYNTYCSDMLDAVVDNWENGFNPFQAWVASKGGYHMGWAYSPGYLEANPYLFWKSATGESWGDTWRKELAYFWVYGIRGDGSMPAGGDAGSLGFTDDARAICLASAKLGNSYAADFADNIGLGLYGADHLWRILFMNGESNNINYSNVTALGKAKEFGKSGYVIARDKWNDPNTTHLVFKSSSFYSRNHHHKDQNSIVLNYKGPLLIDSGSYDSYGSSHWVNYYTRTIAHNTLVVFDAAESFYDSVATPVSNDGGQKYPAYYDSPVGCDPYTLDDILNYSKFQLGGISSFSQTAEQCYMKGDASKAYSSDKLETYTREVTMIYEDQNNNDQPSINIKDHVVLNKSLTPKILFHSVTEPVVDGNGQWFEIENVNGGAVRVELIAPAGAVINVVGGFGYEFMVNGINYLPTYYAPTEPGVWRVEISPSGPVISTDFEFNLKIYDVQ